MKSEGGFPVKTWVKISLTLFLLLVGGFLWLRWKQDEPRRASLAALKTLSAALTSNDREGVLAAVVLPQAVRGRTVPEQAEFLSKALQDEISPEGLTEIRRRGSFGTLKELYPVEGDRWAAQAGARSEDCVAFKMERGGVRAEVVLVREGEGFRVVRCNNVKQMGRAG